MPQMRSAALILSGGISSGAGIAGAIAAGADMAALGTCFIATEESMAAGGHKQMICNAALSDIVYIDRVSGMPASFLAPSLAPFGILDARAGASLRNSGLVWLVALANRRS
ncbi:MAG: nitronate monooxygenase [Sphingomonas sp.]